MQRITTINQDTGVERIYNNMEDAKKAMNPYDRYTIMIDEVETGITLKEILAFTILGFAVYALLNVVGI